MRAWLERRNQPLERTLGALTADERAAFLKGLRTLARRADGRITPMVLSDRTIERLIGEGRIAIDPYDASLLQPSSVDVRVDRYFRVFHNARYPFIDVKQPQEELTEEVEIADDQPFILHPGEFVLGSTLERVTLPDDLVARLEGKSSLGRLGLLIHSTAGFIDPGWDGHVTLELSNVANLPITIYHGMKIGQISFMQLTEPAVDAVRQRLARLEVPGPARPDAESATGRTSSMKILVTGGTGFVGHGDRARAAAHASLDVRALARRPEDAIAPRPRSASRSCAGDLTDAGEPRAGGRRAARTSSTSSRSSRGSPPTSSA